MHIEWLYPVVEEAARKTLVEVLRQGWRRLWNKPVSLAVTGMQGVGKTVLCDYLSGRAYEPGYTPPPPSQKVESAAVGTGRQGYAVNVVPGQPASTARLDALDTLFSGGKPVEGVIHVVASGYASIRTQAAQRYFHRDLQIDTLTKYRNHQLRLEAEDLREICAEIRKAQRKHRAPKWMIVAVYKADLYHSALPQVEEYYSPTSENDFSSPLHELARQVGTDYFRWVSAPVCGYLEGFSWADESVHPQINATARDAYVNQFLGLVASYHPSP